MSEHDVEVLKYIQFIIQLKGSENMPYVTLFFLVVGTKDMLILAYNLLNLNIERKGLFSQRISHTTVSY